MMKKLRSAKGFTMIELMVVLVIIGILAMILVPQLLDNSTKAKFGEIPPTFTTYDRAQLVYFHESSVVNTDNSMIAFSAPANSKFFTYAYTNAATPALTATAINAMGSVSAAEVAKTVVGTDASAAHMLRTANTTALKKYLSSFTSYY